MFSFNSNPNPSPDPPNPNSNPNQNSNPNPNPNPNLPPHPNLPPNLPMNPGPFPTFSNPNPNSNPHTRPPYSFPQVFAPPPFLQNQGQGQLTYGFVPSPYPPMGVIIQPQLPPQGPLFGQQHPPQLQPQLPPQVYGTLPGHPVYPPYPSFSGPLSGSAGYTTFFGHRQVPQKPNENLEGSQGPLGSSGKIPKPGQPDKNHLNRKKFIETINNIMDRPFVKKNNTTTNTNTNKLTPPSPGVQSAHETVEVLFQNIIACQEKTWTENRSDLLSGLPKFTSTGSVETSTKEKRKSFFQNSNLDFTIFSDFTEFSSHPILHTFIQSYLSASKLPEKPENPSASPSPSPSPAPAPSPSPDDSKIQLYPNPFQPDSESRIHNFFKFLTRVLKLGSICDFMMALLWLTKNRKLYFSLKSLDTTLQDLNNLSLLLPPLTPKPNHEIPVAFRENVETLAAIFPDYDPMVLYRALSRSSNVPDAAVDNLIRNYQKIQNEANQEQSRRQEELQLWEKASQQREAKMKVGIAPLKAHQIRFSEIFKGSDLKFEPKEIGKSPDQLEPSSFDTNMDTLDDLFTTDPIQMEVQENRELYIGSMDLFLIILAQLDYLLVERKYGPKLTQTTMNFISNARFEMVEDSELETFFLITYLIRLFSKQLNFSELSSAQRSYIVLCLSRLLVLNVSGIQVKSEMWDLFREELVWLCNSTVEEVPQEVLMVVKTEIEKVLSMTVTKIPVKAKIEVLVKMRVTEMTTADGVREILHFFEKNLDFFAGNLGEATKILDSAWECYVDFTHILLQQGIVDKWTKEVKVEKRPVGLGYFDLLKKIVIYLSLPEIRSKDNLLFNIEFLTRVLQHTDLYLKDLLLCEVNPTSAANIVEFLRVNSIGDLIPLLILGITMCNKAKVPDPLLTHVISSSSLEFINLGIEVLLKLDNLLNSIRNSAPQILTSSGWWLIDAFDGLAFITGYASSLLLNLHYTNGPNSTILDSVLFCDGLKSGPVFEGEEGTWIKSFIESSQNPNDTNSSKLLQWLNANTKFNILVRPKEKKDFDMMTAAVFVTLLYTNGHLKEVIDLSNSITETDLTSNKPPIWLLELWQGQAITNFKRATQGKQVKRISEGSTEYDVYHLVVTKAEFILKFYHKPSQTHAVKLRSSGSWQEDDFRMDLSNSEISKSVFAFLGDEKGQEYLKSLDDNITKRMKQNKERIIGLSYFTKVLDNIKIMNYSGLVNFFTPFPWAFQTPENNLIHYSSDIKGADLSTQRALTTCWENLFMKITPKMNEAKCYLELVLVLLQCWNIRIQSEDLKFVVSSNILSTLQPFISLSQGFSSSIQKFVFSENLTTKEKEKFTEKVSSVALLLFRVLVSQMALLSQNTNVVLDESVFGILFSELQRSENQFKQQSVEGRHSETDCIQILTEKKEFKLPDETMKVSVFPPVKGDFSILFWLNVTTLPDKEFFIFDYGSSGDTSIQIIFMKKVVSFLLRDSLGQSLSVKSKSFIPYGSWVHLACLFEGKTIRLYWNGNLENESTYRQDVKLCFDNINARIGGSRSPGSFHCTLSDFKFTTTRALRPVEILSHYQRGPQLENKGAYISQLLSLFSSVASTPNGKMILFKKEFFDNLKSTYSLGVFQIQSQSLSILKTLFSSTPASIFEVNFGNDIMKFLFEQLILILDGKFSPRGYSGKNVNDLISEIVINLRVMANTALEWKNLLNLIMDKSFAELDENNNQSLIYATCSLYVLGGHPEFARKSKTIKDSSSPGLITNIDTFTKLIFSSCSLEKWHLEDSKSLFVHHYLSSLLRVVSIFSENEEFMKKWRASLQNNQRFVLYLCRVASNEVSKIGSSINSLEDNVIKYWEMYFGNIVQMEKIKAMNILFTRLGNFPETWFQQALEASGNNIEGAIAWFNEKKLDLMNAVKDKITKEEGEEDNVKSVFLRNEKPISAAKKRSKTKSRLSGDQFLINVMKHISKNEKDCKILYSRKIVLFLMTDEQFSFQCFQNTSWIHLVKLLVMRTNELSINGVNARDIVSNLLRTDKNIEYTKEIVSHCSSQLISIGASHQHKVEDIISDKESDKHTLQFPNIHFIEWAIKVYLKTNRISDEMFSMIFQSLVFALKSPLISVKQQILAIFASIFTLMRNEFKFLKDSTKLPELLPITKINRMILNRLSKEQIGSDNYQTSPYLTSQLNFYSSLYSLPGIQYSFNDTMKESSLVDMNKKELFFSICESVSTNSCNICWTPVQSALYCVYIAKSHYAATYINKQQDVSSNRYLGRLRASDLFKQDESDQQWKLVYKGKAEACSIKNLSPGTEFQVLVDAINQEGNLIRRTPVLFVSTEGFVGEPLKLHKVEGKTNLKFSSDLSTVTCEGPAGKNFSMAHFSETAQWSSGVHYWEIKVVSCNKHGADMAEGGGNIFIGIVSDRAFEANQICGIGITNTREIFDSRASLTPLTFGIPFGQDDVIGVLLNLQNNTLRFYLNGNDMGPLFRHEHKQKPLNLIGTRWVPVLGLKSGVSLSVLSNTQFHSSYPSTEKILYEMVEASRLIGCYLKNERIPNSIIPLLYNDWFHWTSELLFDYFTSYGLLIKIRKNQDLNLSRGEKLSVSNKSAMVIGSHGDSIWIQNDGSFECVPYMNENITEQNSRRRKPQSPIALDSQGISIEETSIVPQSKPVRICFTSKTKNKTAPESSDTKEQPKYGDPEFPSQVHHSQLGSTLSSLPVLKELSVGEARIRELIGTYPTLTHSKRPKSNFSGFANYSPVLPNDNSSSTDVPIPTGFLFPNSPPEFPSQIPSSPPSIWVPPEFSENPNPLFPDRKDPLEAFPGPSSPVYEPSSPTYSLSSPPRESSSFPSSPLPFGTTPLRGSTANITSSQMFSEPLPQSNTPFNMGNENPIPFPQQLNGAPTIPFPPQPNVTPNWQGYSRNVAPPPAPVQQPQQTKEPETSTLPPAPVPAPSPSPQVPSSNDKSLLPSVSTRTPIFNNFMEQFNQLSFNEIDKALDLLIIDAFHTFSKKFGSPFSVPVEEIIPGILRDYPEKVTELSKNNTMDVEVYENELVNKEKISIRASLFRVLNKMFMDVLPIVDFSTTNELTALFKSFREYIFSSVKMKIFKCLLESTRYESKPPRDALMSYPEDLPKMVISRRNNSEPIFIQAFNIWKRIPNKALFRQSYSPLIINPVANGFGLMSAKQKRAFLVSFKDEDGVDEGGLYNEFFHEITNELMTSSKLKLFIRTPNHIREDGPEQYLFKTNPALGHQSDDAQAFELFEFVGVLIGIALRCEVVMGFNFPSLFWKYLVDEEVGNEDLERIDARLVASCKEIVDCKAEDYNTNFNDTTWSCVVSSEQNLVHDLIPNGRNIKVSWEQRKEFTEKLIHFELHKKDAPHLEAIKRGISSIIPEGYLSMFSWKELESAICGDPVNIFELKKNAIYEDVSSEEEHVKFFWQVLEELTTEEQEKFLRFAWARSRMPPSGTNQGITISAPPSESRDNPDLFLPRSNTCSFKMHLPQYTTVQNARDKILYAINHCTELDRI